MNPGRQRRQAHRQRKAAAQVANVRRTERLRAHQEWFEAHRRMVGYLGHKRNHQGWWGGAGVGRFYFYGSTMFYTSNPGRREPRFVPSTRVDELRPRPPLLIGMDFGRDEKDETK